MIPNHFARMDNITQTVMEEQKSNTAAKTDQNTVRKRVGNNKDDNKNTVKGDCGKKITE